MTVLRDRWAAGEVTFGAWCEIPSPYATELIGEAGFDWGVFDFQHGVLTLESTSTLIGVLAQSGTASIVRVPADTPWMIEAVLDLGAQAVVVPSVESADQAAIAARAVRYPPLGRRSYGPYRVPTAIGVDPATVNKRVALVVMIETRLGLESVDEIAAVPEVDAIFVGATDLRLSLGHPLDERLDTGIADRILDACERNRITPGIYGGSGKEARFWADRGYRMVACATDRELLLSAARLDFAAARGAQVTPVAAAYSPGALRSAVSSALWQFGSQRADRG